MDTNNEKNNIENLSTKLKEIYSSLKLHTQTQKGAAKQYQMSEWAIRDLVYIDEKYLEEEELKNIINLLKENKTKDVGMMFGIGNNLLAYIRKSAGLVRYKVHNNEKERYQKFYKEAQDMWERVKNGDSVENIAKDKGIKCIDAEEIIYRYSELIKRLQESYRWNPNIKTLERYKKNYYFNDETIEFIRDFKHDDAVNNVIKKFLSRSGIEMRNFGGEEYE